MGSKATSASIWCIHSRSGCFRLCSLWGILCGFLGETCGKLYQKLTRCRGRLTIRWLQHWANATSKFLRLVHCQLEFDQFIPGFVRYLHTQYLRLCVYVFAVSGHCLFEVVRLRLYVCCSSICIFIALDEHIFIRFFNTPGPFVPQASRFIYTAFSEFFNQLWELFNILSFHIPNSGNGDHEYSLGFFQ